MKNLPVVFLLISFVLVSGNHVMASTMVGAAYARITIFEKSLILLKKDIGRYPTTKEGLDALLVPPPGVSNWRGPYVPYGLIPWDPWHHPYIYRYPAIYGDREFDLYSLGKDGVDDKGKGDDITNWHGYDPWQYYPEAMIRRYIVLSTLCLLIVLGIAYFIRKRIKLTA